MSNIANKRKLVVAAQALAHTNAPDLEHFEAVGNALAQVFSDLVGVNCTVVFKVPGLEAADVVKKMGEQP